MKLPDLDQSFLSERALSPNVQIESNMLCLVFPSWGLPTGFNVASADLLLRLPSGYPDLPPDMWWFSPSVTLASGSIIAATEAIEHHLGRPWQRWSRHFAAGQWKPGIDCLESYLALIQRDLERAVGK